MDAFANFDVSVCDWYVVARSRSVGRGQARSFELLDRRVALWRGQNGVPHALGARCPHLGGDLGQGAVVGDRLRCAYHHWTFDRDGRRADGPADQPPRCARRYPVVERFGLLWVFNGDTPGPEVPSLPAGDAESDYWRVLPPPQRIACHPHLVLGNGLDVRHFDTLHGIELSREPILEQAGAREIRVRLQGRLRSPLLARLTGCASAELVARFATLGASVAWGTLESPLRCHVLFTGRPTRDGCCATQTVLFLPRSLPAAARATLLVYTLLRDDRRVLEGLDFHCGFTEADEPLRRFAEIVNGLDRDTPTAPSLR